jgi:hypothetical protein
VVPHECDPAVVAFLYSNDTGKYAPCVQSNPFVAVVAPASERMPHFDGSRCMPPTPIENVAEDPGWKRMGPLVKLGCEGGAEPQHQGRRQLARLLPHTRRVEDAHRLGLKKRRGRVEETGGRHAMCEKKGQRSRRDEE